MLCQIIQELLQVVAANATVRMELCKEFYALHRQLQQPSLHSRLKADLHDQLQQFKQMLSR